eukprot:SAG31_NODE_1914_length_6931_cov_6.490340_7_plen_896_part_00
MAATLAALGGLAAAAAASSNYSWPSGLGHHRAIITLPPSTTPGAAAWATIPWQRRAVPNATTTAAVLTLASSGATIANAVRAPAGPGVADSEALTFVFMPTARGLPPAPGPQPTPGADGFVRNRGTASSSIVTSCSGQQAGCDCWKAVDGKMLFNNAGGAEGWDSVTQGGIGWLEMDLGGVPATPVTKFGVYSVSQTEDHQWFPVGVALLGRSSPDARWTVLLNTTLVLHPANGTNVLAGWPAEDGRARYFRFEIWSRGGADHNSHSYIKEVQFGHAPQSGPPPPPPHPPPPSPMATEYALYFMPFKHSGGETGLSLQAHYLQNVDTAETSWLQKHNLSASSLKDGSFRARLQEATSVTFECSHPFQSFAPMETVATAASVASMLAKHGGAHDAGPVLFFPTDRSNQIKMSEALPQIWADSGPSKLLTGRAEPGELYALQVGVWNAGETNITITPPDIVITALKSSVDGGGLTIPANATRCFNLGGVDYRGIPFTQSTTIAAHSVGALWFAVDVPVHTQTGNYSGTITIGGLKQQAPAVMQVSLAVWAGPPIPNGGADDLWRMARLGWLDSTVGIDRNITTGFAALQLSQSPESPSVLEATLSGKRTLTIGKSHAGDTVTLLKTIQVQTQPVLATPLTVAADGVQWSASSLPLVAHKDNMSATLISVSKSTDGSLELNSSVVINFDGFIDTTVTVTAVGGSKHLNNVTMATSIPDAASTFFMGLANTGGNRTTRYPDGISWKWAHNKGGENQLWAGSGSAGLRVKLKGQAFDWESPLHMQSTPPKSWGGDNATGGVTALPTATGLAITASTGGVTISAGVPLVFRFDLLVTPLKALNTSRHFRRDRYYQYGYNGLAEPSAIADMGTKVLNLHQGVMLNPCARPLRLHLACWSGSD